MSVDWSNVALKAAKEMEDTNRLWMEKNLHYLLSLKYKKRLTLYCRDMRKLLEFSRDLNRYRKIRMYHDYSRKLPKRRIWVN